MGDISTWSPVDESNTAAPPNGWPENMQPSAVNNTGRALMGAVRRWYDTVTAQLANFLPLSGGTLTGPLTGTYISAPTLVGTTNVSTLAIDSITYQLNGVLLASRDVGGWHYIWDYSGASLAMALGPVNNVYRADTHTFQNKANTGAGNLSVGYITASGNVALTGSAALSVGGNTTLNAATINGGVTMASTLSVTGNTTLRTTTFNGNVFVSGVNQLTANGNAYFNGPLTCYNTIYYTTLSALSDAAVKSNVAPYTTGLDAIRQLDPVSFTYVPALRTTSGTKYGLMADDVRSVLPEMAGEVEIDIDGVLQTVATIEPDHLWYVLINAVKELAARVETLEAGR